MIRSLLCLLTVLQTLLTGLNSPSARTTLAMKTGVLLRLHVVAQDDTEAMQTLKLTVRDAVRQAYAAQPRDPADTMLTHTEKLLPILTQAAEDAAAAAGFTGEVTVVMDILDFDRRELDGLIIPEGCYPALMVLLGEAQGHNWWGLIDPQTALLAASVPGGELQWDWSWDGFLAALLRIPAKAGDGHD